MFIPARVARARYARVAVAAIIAASSIALACTSASVTGPKDVPGTYVLRSVNDSPLPYTVPNAVDHTIVINSVTATLSDNNTYAVAGTGTQDGDAATVITDAGTWTQSGDKIDFSSTHLAGAFYFAHAKEDTVTVTLPGGFVNSTTGTFSLLFVKGS